MLSLWTPLIEWAEKSFQQQAEVSTFYRDIGTPLLSVPCSGTFQGQGPFWAHSHTPTCRHTGSLLAVATTHTNIWLQLLICALPLATTELPGVWQQFCSVPVDPNSQSSHQSALTAHDHLCRGVLGKKATFYRHNSSKSGGNCFIILLQLCHLFPFWHIAFSEGL